jgi:predicted RNA-binding protein with PIN domain
VAGGEDLDAVRAGPTAAPSPLIVDVMNVIGSRPDGWWRDRRGAMARLVEALDLYVHATGTPVTAVLDGRAFALDRPDLEVDILFAGHGRPNAADDAIVELLRDRPEHSAATVVTSDRELSRRVQALGAAVVGAGAFRRDLDERAKEPGRT